MSSNPDKPQRRKRAAKAVEPPVEDAVPTVAAPDGSDKQGGLVYYSDELAERICEEVAMGCPLHRIPDVEGMPSEKTLYRWMRKRQAFFEQVMRAKMESAVRMIEEVIEIADDGRNDWIEKFSEEGELLGFRVNGEAIARSKLRVDTRIRLAERMLPALYGFRSVFPGAEAGGGSDVPQLPLQHASRVAAEVLALARTTAEDAVIVGGDDGGA